jgi:DNA damage-binding protein 1
MKIIGSLKVLPIESGSVREAYNVPLDEFMILDLVFLHGSPRPTVCVLYEDPKQARHVKTYIIDNTERELLPGASQKVTRKALGILKYAFLYTVT